MNRRVLDPSGRSKAARRTPVLARLVAGVVAVALPVGLSVGLAPGRAQAQVPSEPFAAVQYGTNGCIEVGARDTQPKPFFVPPGYDITSGYPAFGYDTTGFTQTTGTNACRYSFRDKDPRKEPSSVIIGSGYCVQWAAGQASGTGYDPEPENGTVRPCHPAR